MKNIFLSGASAGIGLASAQLLTQHGYQVWGTSRSKGKLPRLTNFHPIEMDLADPHSIHSAFQQAELEAGHFDILINNAGEGVLGPLETFSMEEFRKQLEVLVLGPHELIRLVLPGMRERNQGTILNVSSLAARFPVPFLGPYSAAKAALANYSETLRLELSNTSLRIIDLQPGDINTAFDQVAKTTDSPVSPQYHQLFCRARSVMDFHMRRGPQPELVAQTMLTIFQREKKNSPHTVGTFYQAVFSPFLARILPNWLLEKALKDYYKLGDL